MNIDFGKTAEDYGRYRAGFPAEFFEQLLRLQYVREGDAVLDLGTGTGTLARALALRGCRITGLDRAKELLNEAKRLDAESGANAHYIQAQAEATGLPSGQFDVVTAGQCWHWFDGTAAAREAHRVLRPAGRIIIGHHDWVPLPGNVVEATEQLITQHNPEWKLAGGTGLHPACLTDLAIATFSDIETFSFDWPASYSHEAWRGRIRASAGVGASLPKDAVLRFDRELAQLLRAGFPEEPLIVPHRIWTATAVSTSE